MADVYCDQSLASGNDDGTNWTNAYKVLSNALDGTNTGASDTLWVKNDVTLGSSVTLKCLSAASHDPPNVIGCISAASNTPPLASEIVPGLRNGSSTRAYDQVSANSPPTLSLSGTTLDITLRGFFGIIYGIVLRASDDITLMDDVSAGTIEECRFAAGIGSGTGKNIFVGNLTRVEDTSCHFLNCKLDSGGSGSSNLSTGSRVGYFTFKSCEIEFVHTGGMVLVQSSAQMVFDSCDFSGSSSPVVAISSQIIALSRPTFLNCKINASSALTTGTSSNRYKIEFIGVSSASGKTTGQSFQEVEIITDTGTIVQEATAVRTTGADDGASGAWSLAFTPDIDQTRDNVLAMVGPWMTVEIVGDGTSQTLTVYIANSGASDYFDDDVWLEVVYPSESGVAQYDYATTQMDMVATPAVVTDDGSTWGSGGNNPQKFVITTIAPDYDGFLKCRVHFAKNFGSSPETLYVDPLPVIS